MKRLSTVAVLLVAVALSFGQSPKGLYQSPNTKADLDKKELAAIATAEKAQVAAKAASSKAPKDKKAKKAYVAATLSLADMVLVTPALGPKEKYPKSLRLYREAYKADPGNAKAKSKIDLIEGIYKSMGRPIPK